MTDRVEARTDRIPADRLYLGASGYLWHADANRCVAKHFTRDADLKLYRAPFANEHAAGIRLVDVDGTVYAESFISRDAL